MPGLGIFTSEFANNIFSTAQLKAPYDTYIIVVEYNVSFGKLQLPVAPVVTSGQASSPQQLIVLNLQPSEIVVTRLPFGRKTVTWLASRLGQYPTVPNPFSQDPNLVLADMVFRPMAAIPTKDGQNRIYALSGTYTYFEKTPVGPGAGKIWFPATDADTIGIEQIPSGVFSNTLVG